MQALADRGTWRGSRIVGLALLIAVTVVALLPGPSGDATWRNAWWDLQHRLLPRDRGDPAAAPALVVAIDERSMELVHPWPWPRDYMAALVSKLAASGARSVALDVLMLQADSQSPLAHADRYRRIGFEALADQIRSLGDTDAALAQALRSVPTVLPVSGVPDHQNLNLAQECDFAAPPIMMDKQAVALPDGLPAVDIPYKPLAENAAGLAAIDFEASEHFVIRRVPAVQNICGVPFPVLGIEAYRQASGALLTRIEPSALGLTISFEGSDDGATAPIPAESDGSFWLRFGHVGALGDDGVRTLPRYLSAADVLSTDFDGDRIAGKIALVAVVDLGRVDERRSPLGEIVYGVEAHMQMIEMIDAGTYLRRFDIFYPAELALLIAAGLAILLLVPTASPVSSVVLLLAGTGLTLGVSLGAFELGYLLDLITPILGAAIVATGVMALTLIERDRARLLSEVALQSERADRAFLQGELDAAARIQKALLPPTVFGVPDKIDLACHIDPARTVGGDFYDHVLIDERHLFFLVADVSGKGADASQFMLLSKTLWKSVALRTGADLEKIQLDANAEITRENAALMFVTGLVGIIDLDTRRLYYSSAGHDAPFLFSNTRLPAQIEPFSGPPAGLMEDLSFPVGTAELEAGDCLCIFTDGVTEAMNQDGELFGLERLEETLATAPRGLEPEALVAHVVERVAVFTGTAEQSDDLTLMIIRVG